MKFLLLLCLVLLPFPIGKAALRVMHERENALADAILTGWIVCIGASEAIHLAVFFTGRPFSDTAKLALPVFGLLLAASVGILLYAGRGKKGVRPSAKFPTQQPYTVLQIMAFIAFALLVIRQIFAITASGVMYAEGDMTVETVNSFLDADAFYRINPMTGRAYEAGVPLRLQILCLPTLYGMLCKTFGLTASEVVWRTIPLVTLLAAYLAYYILARCLFPGKEDRMKREIFMLLAALLFCVGDYSYGTDGLGLLYSGFRGVTIRNAVLVPYTFSLCLRRRYRSVALCVLAEACIVWTLYGLGTCLLAALLFEGLLLLRRIADKRRSGAGKEADAECNG